MSKPTDTDILEDLGLSDVEAMFVFLDDLRESGATNMYGAIPYLIEEFDLQRREASAVLSAWMRTFDGDMSVPARVAEAMASA